MKIRTRGRHVIDMVFPIALFFVFAASALAVLILAADIYSSANRQLDVNEEKYTPLSYISEKIRQSDTGGAIDIVNIDGTECLALSENYDGVGCTTYIYACDGMLKELFIRDDVPVSLEGGTDILEIVSLEIDEPEEGLFRFTLVDRDGRKTSMLASERSMP